MLDESTRHRRMVTMRHLLRLAADQAGTPEGDQAAARIREWSERHGIVPEDLDEVSSTFEAATGTFAWRYDLLLVVSLRDAVEVVPPGEDGCPGVRGPEVGRKRTLLGYRSLRRAVEGGALAHVPFTWDRRHPTFLRDWCWSALSGVLDRVLSEVDAKEEVKVALASEPVSTLEAAGVEDGAGGDSPSLDAFEPPDDLVFYPDAYRVGFETHLPEREVRCLATTKRRRLDWALIEPLLGTLSDAVLARRFGCAVSTLATRRRALGRMPVPREGAVVVPLLWKGGPKEGKSL